MFKSEAEEKYKDIMDMPHPVSATRPRMARADRAAQFSPFAALTGYDAAVAETARLTEEERELTEDMRAAIDQKLCALSDGAMDGARVSVTYFRPDERKAGGAYVTMDGEVREVDTYTCELVMTNGGRIPVTCIRTLDILD